MKSKQALGVDVGNVIINHRLSDPRDTTLHEERYSTIPATEGVFDALKTLNTYFEGEVHLISKCTEWAQEKILIWLKDNDFYSKTGINPENIYFVRERYEKDVLCRKLSITHFIDDRLEVLGHMVDSVPHLLLFQPNQEEMHKFEACIEKVTVVNNWEEVIESICG